MPSKYGLNASSYFVLLRPTSSTYHHKGLLGVCRDNASSVPNEIKGGLSILRVRNVSSHQCVRPSCSCKARRKMGQFCRFGRTLLHSECAVLSWGRCSWASEFRKIPILSDRVPERAPTPNKLRLQYPLGLCRDPLLFSETKGWIRRASTSRTMIS